MNHFQNWNHFQINNFQFFGLLLFFVHPNFWYTIIFGSPEFLVHYYFSFSRILVSFLFIIIFGSLVFLVRYYFRFIRILGPSRFTNIFGSPSFFITDIFCLFSVFIRFSDSFCFVFCFILSFMFLFSVLYLV